MNSKKIKLLRVITQAEVVVWHLRNFINLSKDDFDLYIAGNDVSRYKELFPHVKFLDIPISRKVSFINDVKSIWHLFVICLKIRPKIIHSILPKSGFLCSIAGFFAFVPIRMHTFTGQIWVPKKGISRILLKTVDKIVFKLNTLCLTDSPSQSAFLIKQGFVNRKTPIRCLGYGSFAGVDLNLFKPLSNAERDSIRKEFGLRRGDFVYIYLARKSIVKGITPLFESFDKISHLGNVKLLFIGPDESEGALNVLLQKYEHLRDKIISLDIVSEHQKYLAIADVLCLPSSSEGFGTIVIEASAVGTPSIGFDIVGLSDAIEDGESGFLVPFGSIEKFAEKMEYLYNSSEELERLKFNGLKRVSKLFSASVIYNDQKKVYDSLLAKFL